SNSPKVTRMARSGPDIKRMVLAAVLTGGIGTALVILSVIIQLLSLAITDQNAELVDTVYSVFGFLMIPVFFGLYFWTGMRAVKRFGFDAVGAGTVTAMAYFVVESIRLALNLIDF